MVIYVIYVIIFFLKVLENMLSTLRTIFITSNNKIIAAILLFISSIIWILSSSITIININILSILVFSTGSFIGAYLGIFLEEKIALGTCFIFCITDKDISDYLRNQGYIITSLKGKGINGEKNILLIIIERKKLKELINFIYKINKDAIITSEYTNYIKNRLI